jgi:transposase
MLRRVRVEAQPVAAVARAFGCSRQALYEAQAAFSSEGLAGLLPDKRGPRTAHKLAAHVVTFLQEYRSAEPAVSSAALARLVQRRFRISVHPRSVERALSRAEKNTRSRGVIASGHLTARMLRATRSAGLRDASPPCDRVPAARG